MAIENLSLNDNINDILIDDCLINIFEYLPLNDKLMIELVCKKWEILGRLSWTKVKSFKMAINANQEAFILNVLKRSGFYINKLSIEICENVNPSTVFEAASKICQNITSFELKNFKFVGERKLGLFFKNNMKISVLIFIDSSFNGISLKNLCAESITELRLDNCVFRSEDNLNNFFSKLANLKVIEIVSTDSKNLVLALNSSNCDNIHEFSLMEDTCDTELCKLLSKQKKLCKLDLGSLSPKTNLLNSLLECPLQELAVGYLEEEMFRILSCFKNLTVLDCFIESLTDELIKNLTKCVNLKKIDLSVKNISLTVDGEDSFSELSKIESFTFSCGMKCIDRILDGLTRCKNNVKELYLIKCKISNSGLKSISLLKNLEILMLIIASIENSTDLMNVIKELPNLIKIGAHCDSETSEEFNNSFFKTINDAKINRGDKQVLKMYIYDKTYEEDFKNQFSLLSIS